MLHARVTATLDSTHTRRLPGIAMSQRMEVRYSLYNNLSMLYTHTTISHLLLFLAVMRSDRRKMTPLGQRQNENARIEADMSHS